MATTPVTARNVYWENDASELSFASPLRDVSAQSIQYVNAQLVAHGFTHGTGIRLDALPGKDQQVALKCLVNMLGQRVVDMARTEELTTKYKTLAYDHERLVAQHSLALTTATTAERDVETAKARMNTMLKKLATEEETHRKSREEFQKLKSSMQYLRQTTANELKRKEKEVEKIVERLGKVSNDQIKLGTVGAGLACTNLHPDNPLPQDKHYLDAALNQSEAARLALLKENDALRDTILACANALQSVHHIALASMTENELEEPQLILSQTLFSATNGEQTQAMAAQAKLRNLFSQLRDSVAQITEDRDAQRQVKVTQQQELEELRDLAAEYEARLPMHDGYTPAQSTNVATTDLIAKEEDLARAIEQQRQELQALAEERSKIAEATTQLEQDRVALEAERIRFLEERAAFDHHSVDNTPKANDDRAPTVDRPCTPEPTAYAHQRASSPISPEEPRLRVRRPSSSIPLAVPKRKSPPVTKPIFSHPKPETSAEPEVVRPTTPPAPLRRSLSEHIQANLKEPSPPKFRPPSPIPAFLWERDEVLQDDESPALTENDLIMPYERDGLYPSFLEPAMLQGNRAPLRRSSEKKSAQPGMAIPPHLKTPTRPLSSVPKKHKYSPVVPSPLSRIAEMGESLSPGSSPEPVAMKKLQPVEEERTAELLEQFLQAHEADSGDEDVFSDDDSELCEDDLQGSSNSPLTHILNMGASPALAPLVSGFQFPGLLLPAPPLNLAVESLKPEAASNKAVNLTRDVKGRAAVLEKADNANGAHRTERPQHAAKGSKKSSSSSIGSDSGSSGSDTYAKTRPTSALSIRPKPSRTITTSRPAPTTKGRISDRSEKENAGNKLVPLRKPSGIPPKSAPGTVKPTSRPPSAAGVSRKVPSAPGAASRPTAPNRIVKWS